MDDNDFFQKFEETLVNNNGVKERERGVIKQTMKRIKWLEEPLSTKAKGKAKVSMA